VYPFLLEVYADYEQKRLSRADFVAILKLIESYVFRRMISGLYATGLNKVFATLAKEIDKGHYLESVQANLLQRSGSARFPRDQEFQAAFVVKDIYNFLKRRYLLSKLENYKWKEYVNIDEYTIEHILPQNQNLSPVWQAELGPDWQEVQAKYLHTIGNLTLTGYNPEMSDRPFQEKRDMESGFAHSKLRLNDGFEQLEHWNAEEIEKRAQRLAMFASEIWSLPLLSLEQMNKYGRRTQRVPLAEAIGPMQHSLAGFIPAGYKIAPQTSKRFYYYRLVDGTWVQYGNGKHAWFRNSWEDAGKRVRGFAQEDAKPLGVGGELDPRYAKISNSDGTLSSQDDEDETNDKNIYTFDNYPFLQGEMYSLFESLRKRILNLDPLVREEYKKLYIAYKTTTNFVDIEPCKSFLKLFLNMPFDKIDDPKNLCKDVTSIGHHGNGDIEIHLSSPDQLDDVMDLIRQAFEERWEEGAA
jgi:predicted transport protein